MALSKSGVNVILAVIVVALALTSITLLYVNSSKQDVRPAAAQTQEQSPGASALPANHPAIDSANTLATLEKMSAADPQNPDYPAQIANLYYDAGQYDKAAGFYEKSLKLRPKDPNVETDLAACLHYVEQDDKALEMLDKVLAYSPGFSQAMYNKGIILIGAKKDIKSGIKVWEDLLRLNPDYAQKAELEQKISQLKNAIK
jgi:cytochrome c-type biogenesis protein CcmH/NrfG